jgi:hypothetical protein
LLGWGFFLATANGSAAVQRLHVFSNRLQLVW